MREIRSAFATFWGGFLNNSTSPGVSIPAFPSGYAAENTPQGPQAPEFPYITYDLARLPFDDFTVLSAKIWTRSTAWSLVDDVLSQAANRIPEGGTRIEVGAGGGMLLYRSNPFTQYLPPEESDLLIKAGVIRVIVKSFIV